MVARDADFTTEPVMQGFKREIGARPLVRNVECTVANELLLGGFLDTLRTTHPALAALDGLLDKDVVPSGPTDRAAGLEACWLVGTGKAVQRGLRAATAGQLAQYMRESYDAPDALDQHGRAWTAEELITALNTGKVQVFQRARLPSGQLLHTASYKQPKLASDSACAGAAAASAVLSSCVTQTRGER